MTLADRLAKTHQRDRIAEKRDRSSKLKFPVVLQEAERQNVIVYWLTTRERTDLKRFVVLGALVGCATLVRWQEATLLILPVLDAARARGRAGRRGCRSA